VVLLLSAGGIRGLSGVFSSGIIFFSSDSTYFSPSASVAFEEEEEEEEGTCGGENRQPGRKQKKTGIAEISSIRKSPMRMLMTTIHRAHVNVFSDTEERSINKNAEARKAVS